MGALDISKPGMEIDLGISMPKLVMPLMEKRVACSHSEGQLKFIKSLEYEDKFIRTRGH